MKDERIEKLIEEIYYLTIEIEALCVALKSKRLPIKQEIYIPDFPWRYRN